MAIFIRKMVQKFRILVILVAKNHQNLKKIEKSNLFLSAENWLFCSTVYGSNHLLLISHENFVKIPENVLSITTEFIRRTKVFIFMIRPYVGKKILYGFCIYTIITRPSHLLAPSSWVMTPLRPPMHICDKRCVNFE